MEPSALTARLPQLFNLRSDPFERGQYSIYYQMWMADRMFTLVPAQAIVGEFLKTFQEFPPRQKPSSFSIDAVMEQAMSAQAKLAGATGGGPK